MVSTKSTSNGTSTITPEFAMRQFCYLLLALFAGAQVCLAQYVSIRTMRKAWGDTFENVNIPSIFYQPNLVTIPRSQARALPVMHRNIDTLVVQIIAVPENRLIALLSQQTHSGYTLKRRSPAAYYLLQNKIARHIQVSNRFKEKILTVLPLPPDSHTVGRGLWLVSMHGTGRYGTTDSTLTQMVIIQNTDLALHTKTGTWGHDIWVTHIPTGKPVHGATVRIFGAPVTVSAPNDSTYTSTVFATAVTDSLGRARISGPRVDSPWTGSLAIEAFTATDRVVAAIGRPLGPHISGVMYTDRRQYYPGDTIRMTGIARQFTDGLVTVAQPDSVTFILQLITQNERQYLSRIPVTISSAGFANASVVIPDTTPPGTYHIMMTTPNPISEWEKWQTIAEDSVIVRGNYTYPMTLALQIRDTGVYVPGDTVMATLQASASTRAPLPRDTITWRVGVKHTSPWDIRIPRTTGFWFGNSHWYGRHALNPFDGFYYQKDVKTVLDRDGQTSLAVPLVPDTIGLPGTLILESSINDQYQRPVVVNTTIGMRSAEFLLGVRSASRGYMPLWVSQQEPQSLEIIAARPNGNRVPGVPVSIAIARLRYIPDTSNNNFLDWITVEDTIFQSTVVTTSSSILHPVIFPGTGWYIIYLSARDSQGRRVFTAWDQHVTGPDLYQTGPDTTGGLRVLSDKRRYVPGDTARIFIQSPVPNAEVWVTIERAKVLDEWRLTFPSGTGTLDIPVLDGYAPTIALTVTTIHPIPVKDRPLYDSSVAIERRSLLLNVEPVEKQLRVQLIPQDASHQSSPTTSVNIIVTDAHNRPATAEVAVWVVEETEATRIWDEQPDIIRQMYRKSVNPFFRYQAETAFLTTANNLVSWNPRQMSEMVAEEPNAWYCYVRGRGIYIHSFEPVRVNPSHRTYARRESTLLFQTGIKTDPAGRASISVDLHRGGKSYRVIAVAATAGDMYGMGSAVLHSR